MKSDSKLQQDVLPERTWEPSVDHADIGVSVTDGVATLNGYVKRQTTFGGGTRELLANPPLSPFNAWRGVR